MAAPGKLFYGVGTGQNDHRRLGQGLCRPQRLPQLTPALQAVDRRVRAQANGRVIEQLPAHLSGIEPAGFGEIKPAPGQGDAGQPARFGGVDKPAQLVWPQGVCDFCKRV